MHLRVREELFYMDIYKQLNISTIIQGFWRLVSWNWTTEKLEYYLQSCIELGVTTFDVAEIYANGVCEIQLGKALSQITTSRERLQIISKTGIVRGNTIKYYDTRKEHIINSCKEILKRLRTEYLDVFLIHRPDPCADLYEIAEAFEYLVVNGYVRSVGTSNFGVVTFSMLQNICNIPLITNQIEISPLCFENFENGMIDYMTAQRIRPMAWSPLNGGEIFKGTSERCKNVRNVLTDLAEIYSTSINTIVYAWLLYHPCKIFPISGSSQIEHLKMATNAKKIALKHEDWYRIYTASKEQCLK